MVLQFQTLQKLLQHDPESNVFSDIDDIFFESSPRKNFISHDEKAKFKFKYLDWYKEIAPELFLVARNPQLDVLGYICGIGSTEKHSDLLALHPWYSSVSPLCVQFPAHLHINVSSTRQGQGIGSALLIELETILKEQNISGVHVLTATRARNVGFYTKNGYNFRKAFLWNDIELLFMGKEMVSEDKGNEK